MDFLRTHCTHRLSYFWLQEFPNLLRKRSWIVFNIYKTIPFDPFGYMNLITNDKW